MTECSHRITMELPATRDDLLIARMALSGVGMLAGLDVDQIGDLRTVVNECCDCLLHRSPLPACIQMDAEQRDGRLFVRFSAQDGDQPGEGEPLDLDVARAVLETLMPEVALHTDAYGVSSIECSMPV